MSNQRIKSYRSYLLHFGSEPSPGPDQPPTRIFIIEDISGQAQRREFCTLEQVMNFLLDELLGQSEEVPQTEGD
jgi:hypothetical protein